jgi:hypothetical protein
MFKVGGMRFLRIGKLQISWCICTGRPKRQKKYTGRAIARAVKTGYVNGYNAGMSDGAFFRTSGPLQIANH